MKKLLILLFSILISFNSYGEVELDFSSNTFCDQSPKVQVRGNLLYLLNQQKPYSGENLCVYLSNGQYYSQGKIINGLRDGIWSFWSKNGQKSRKGNYKDGYLTNETEYYYYDNGQIKSERPYLNNELHGKLTDWFENGQIKSEGNYIVGQLHGKLTYWSFDFNQKIKELDYKNNNVVNRALFKYYANGQLDTESNYKDNRLNGKSTLWYMTGQKFGEGNYKDGKIDGKWTWWNKKGQKFEEVNYKDGDLVDTTLFKYSYFTGHLKSEKKYKDGKCISVNC